MRTKNEIKNDLEKALKLSCDEPLKNLGFQRREETICYTRRYEGIRQSISMDFDMFPKYQIDAEIHIHPAMYLSIKSVSDATLELVGGNKTLLANAPDIIINQPIEFSAPKEKHLRKFASGFIEINKRVNETVKFIERWVMPVFEVLKNTEGLINIYNNNDNRVMKQRHWYMFISGAELSIGNKKRALEVLEKNFSGARSRRKYSMAFEMLTRNTD